MGELIPFRLQTVELQPKDLVITLTDGYPDQFGGPKNKKFMNKALKEFILTLSNEPTKSIHSKLQEKFQEWKGDEEQINDVLIVGVRIT